MVASTAPTGTLLPSAALISPITPACGAGTSSVTLSVSSSTTGSSRSTLSPGCFSHFATVASVTDSPRVGTRISAVIGRPQPSRRQCLRDELRLFLHMPLEEAGGRCGGPGSADKARPSRRDIEARKHLLDPTINKSPGPHVFRLFLAPHHFGIAIALQYLAEANARERVELFEAYQRDRVVALL